MTSEHGMFLPEGEVPNEVPNECDAAVPAYQAVLGDSQACLSGVNCLKPVVKLPLFGLKY